MPLDRAHVTVASRVMLPAYPLFMGALGVSFVVAPDRILLKTPTFNFADRLAPLPLWGVMFLLAAAGMTLALLIHRRAAYQAAIVVAFGAMGWWTILTFASTVAGDASPTAALWPAFVSVALYATYQSLVSREV